MHRITVAVIFLASGIYGTIAAADFHVAPLSTGGNDSNSGTAEKPFATLTAARDGSRHQKDGTGSRILVHGGNYYSVALLLEPEDSGLSILAAPGEAPWLYGGIRLAGWQKDGDSFYAAKLPEPDRTNAKSNPWQIRMVLVDGRMCPRARYPETGTLTHLTAFDVPWMSTTGGGWKRKPTQLELTSLSYKPADLGAWLEPRDAEITIYHMWDESCVGVASNDAEKHILTLAPPTGHPPGAFGVKKYTLWNIREGLKQPGQWYHDRVNGRIVYWPLPGQDMSKAEVLVPTVSSLILLRGKPQTPVKDITLRGLSMSLANVPLVSAGFAAEGFDGAISMEHTQNCRLDGLTISRVAGHGINAKGECQGARVENCDVSQCGAGGIYVGGSKATIANNHVHGVGLFYPSAIGIYRGGKENTVSHNEVHDCSYCAINYGGDANIIEDNLLYDCMKVLHDGAAIYLFGAKNCIIRRNLARDFSDSGGYGASAYYLDEQSENCVVEDNISLRVAWPSHNHMARKNTLRHNLFIIFGDAKLTFPRSSDYTLEKNVVYATGKLRIENIDCITKWSKNLFFSGSGKIEGIQLKEYAKTGTTDGVRGDTVAKDPLFEDVQNGVFSFKAGSPAFELGIEPLLLKPGRDK